MNYRRIFHCAFYLPILFIRHLFSRVLDAVAAPCMAVLRTTPVSQALALMVKFKTIAVRVIAVLKPVYRESYLSNGHSLALDRG